MGVAFGVYALLLIAVNLGVTQRWMGRQAAAWLGHKVGTDVRIGRARLISFNRVDLEDVFVPDRNGDALLQAGRVSAKIAWRPLLDGQVRLRSVALMDGNVRLQRARPDTAGNWQFFLDAFRGKGEKPARLDLAMGSVIVRRTAVSYDVLSAPHRSAGTDLQHLHVEGLEASVSLRSLTRDALRLRVRHLALRERGGLVVKDLAGRFAADRKGLRVRDLRLRLPASALRLDSVAISYDRAGGESLLAALRFQTSLHDAIVAPADLAFALPQLGGSRDVFHVSGDVQLARDFARLRNLDVWTADGGLQVRGDVKAERRGGAFTGVSARMERVAVKRAWARDFAWLLTHRELPASVLALGDVEVAGDVRLTRAPEYNVVRGVAQTALGKARVDVAWRGRLAHGSVALEDFSPGNLLKGTPLPQNVTASVRGEVDFTNKTDIAASGEVKLARATYDGRTYRDVQATGTYKGGRLALSVTSNDPDMDLEGTFSARYVGRDFSDVEADLRVRRLVLGSLGIKAPWAGATLGGVLRAHVPSPTLLQPDGEVFLQNFSLTGITHPVALEGLHVKAVPSQRGVRVDATTDFMTLRADGPPSIAALKRTVRVLVARALGEVPERVPEGGFGEWVVDAEVQGNGLPEALRGLPVRLKSPLTVVGNLRADGGHMALTAKADSLEISGVTLADASLYAVGDGEELRGVAQGRRGTGDDATRFALDLRTTWEGLRTNLKWEAGARHFIRGEVDLLSAFSSGLGGGKAVRTTVRPSHLSIGDTVWDITGGEIRYDRRELVVNDFAMSHADQSLRVDGTLSAEADDSIVATLRKVDVEYIMGLVNFHSVDFAGQATGKMQLRRSDGALRVSCDAQVPDYRMNGADMGSLHLQGYYNFDDKQLFIDGHIANRDSGTTAVTGLVDIGAKQLDLEIQGEHTPLGFIGRYVTGIFRNFEGEATGRCHLYGPFKQLDFEGLENAEASAEVISTGATYRLYGGTVSMVPGVFAFRGFTMDDLRRGRGEMNGTLRHDHLKNIRYDFDATASNLLVYDQPRSIDLPFYSTAYASGNIHLQGYPGSFEADMAIRPERGTTLTYTVNTPETFDDNAFVSFRDKLHEAETDSLQPNGEPAPDEREATTDIRLNMLIEANPDATIKIIMDEKAGDNIVVHGNGSLRANYYNKGQFALFGTYTIDDGIYKMSISDVIRKDFHLTQGGTLTFGGNPYQGDLDMQAVYTVNSASLSDLNVASNFSQNSVKVNCLLNFSGKVMNPQVSFDLDLPSLGEDEKQMVRNVISTEEDMNMQVIYLLGFGRFYSYNYSSVGTSTVAGEQSAAAMKSFLSTTLSSQINNVISNAMGTTKWTFGANVSTGSLGTNEMEVEGLLSGRLLNNRLLVNGNFGYRDNSVYNTNFIGDFDVQYLLTPGGSVSLKAYSETNDRYFTKSSLTTQGAGILLRRDFSNLRDLFRRGRSKQVSDGGKTKKTERGK